MIQEISRIEYLTPEHDRPGNVPADPEGSHYRYLWRAQYDNLRTGKWVEQRDANGMSRSIAWLDPQRVVRIELNPWQETSRPIIELRINRAKGETGTKWWQVTKMLGGTEGDLVREVMCLDTRGAMPYLVYDWEHNRITLTTNADL